MSRPAALAFPALIVATALACQAACQATTEPMPVVPAATLAPTASAPAPAPIASSAPVAKKAPLRPIIFSGHRNPQNVVWTQGGFAIATHDELWRVSIRDSLNVQSASFSHPVGKDAAMGSNHTSNIVAVGLDEGSVDVFRGGTRLRNLPDRAHDGPVLQIHLSPNGKTIAVVRSNGTWPEKTVVYDADSGAERVATEGGNIVFDDAGAYFTGREGLSDVAAGRLVWKWTEGFYVLGEHGMVPTSQIRRGSEMVAQDYSARGFWNGRAVFAGIGDVFVVEPKTGAATKLAASCSPNKRKLRSHFDGPRGRVIGVCTDSVLVTSLETGTTDRLSGGKFGDSTFPPSIGTTADGAKIVIWSREHWVVDPLARTVAIATPEQLQAAANAVNERQCSGRGMPRVDMPCTTGPQSEDGQYVLGLLAGGVVLERASTQKADFQIGGDGTGSALLVPRGTAFDVFAAQGEGAPRYRIGVGSPTALALPPQSPTTQQIPGCGKERQYFHSAIQGGIVYTSYAGSQQVACLCTDAGCKQLSASPGTWFLAASSDGAVLGNTANSTMTETTLHLRRGGREVATASVTGHCTHATFAPDGRIFASCAPQPLQEELITELHPKTLATLGRRMAPLGTTSHLDANADTLAITGPQNETGTVTLVPLDWAKDPALAVRSTVYLGRTGMLVERGADLSSVGDAEDLLPRVRCWNGERLFPASVCRDAFAP